MELDDNETRLWSRAHYPGAPGRPLALAPTLTPVPAWAMLAGLLVLPVGMVLSFFVRRQIVVLFSGEIAVCEVSFWKQRYVRQLLRFTPGERPLALAGRSLEVDGRRLHLEPGWRSSAERIAAA